MSNDCIFCQIVAGQAPATIVRESGPSLGIVPLNPVTEGHVIFLPKRHVTDALADPLATADTMRDASVYARAQTYHQHVNLITSVGMLATQSVGHLHIHVVPRHPHDGLVLPWGDNERQSRQYRENAYRFYSGGWGATDESEREQ